MCGRFALSAKTSSIERLLPNLKIDAEIKAKYNIAPSRAIAAVLNHKPYEISYLRWGLIPFWAKDEKIGYKMINARAESISVKPSYKSSFSKKRCLILTTGFYEWKKVEYSTKKVPYFIQMKDKTPFTFAGLWDSWKSPKGSIISSATIITTVPNKLIESIHNRMPVIIDEKQREEWLALDSSQNYLNELLIPFNSELMDAYEVSIAVNNPGFDNISLIKPYSSAM